MEKASSRPAKFLADESLGLKVAQSLRRLGIDIIAIAEFDRGASDVKVLSIAFREKRILITADKDFGYLVFKEKMTNNGVVLIRLKNESVANLTRVTRRLIVSYKNKISGKFIVASEGRIKVRKI